MPQIACVRRWGNLAVLFENPHAQVELSTESGYAGERSGPDHSLSGLTEQRSEAYAPV